MERDTERLIDRPLAPVMIAALAAGGGEPGGRPAARATLPPDVPPGKEGGGNPSQSAGPGECPGIPAVERGEGLRLPEIVVALLDLCRRTIFQRLLGSLVPTTGTVGPWTYGALPWIADDSGGRRGGSEPGVVPVCWSRPSSGASPSTGQVNVRSSISGRAITSRSTNRE